MEQAGNAKASPADQQSNETLHITNKLPTNQLIMGAEDRSQPRYNSLRNRGFRITQGGTSQQPSSCSRLQQSFELRTASSSSNGLKNPLNNIFWIYKIPLPSFFFFRLSAGTLFCDLPCILDYMNQAKYFYIPETFQLAKTAMFQI